MKNDQKISPSVEYIWNRTDKLFKLILWVYFYGSMRAFAKEFDKLSPFHVKFEYPFTILICILIIVAFLLILREIYEWSGILSPNITPKDIGIFVFIIFFFVSFVLCFLMVFSFSSAIGELISNLRMEQIHQAC